MTHWWWKTHVVGAALCLPVALRVIKPAALADWIGRRRPKGVTAPPDEDLAEWTDRLQRLLPGPWRSDCRRRSFVLYYLLRRAGRDAELNLGVRRTAAGTLDAHAWLTRRGTAILEPLASAATYRVVASFPLARPQ